MTAATPIFIWIIALLLKLIFSAFYPLVPDEAYYWVWSQHLQLSYYDHPPMVAWLFYLGSPFEGFFSAVRWPAVLMGHLTYLIWLKALAKWLSPEQQLWWLILALASPLLGVGSTIITPDIPLMFFWALSFWHLSRIENPKAVDFFAAGLILGVGFLGKYTVVLFGPLALIYLLKRGWYNQRTPRYISISIIGFLITSLPVFLWNSQNEWVSFAFQSKHGLGGGSWQPFWTLGYALGQIFLIFPTILYLALRRVRNKKPLLLVLFGFGPLLFFFFTSFKGKVEANWPIMAYPVILALAVYGCHSWRWARVTVLAWALLVVAILTQAAFPWLPLAADKLRTYELTKFDLLVEETKNLTPLFADTYQMASKLSFEQKRMVYKLKGLSRVDFFDHLSESQPNAKQFYLATLKNRNLPPWAREIYKIVDTKKINENFNILKVVRK